MDSSLLESRRRYKKKPIYSTLYILKRLAYHSDLFYYNYIKIFRSGQVYQQEKERGQAGVQIGSHYLSCCIAAIYLDARNHSIYTPTTLSYCCRPQARQKGEETLLTYPHCLRKALQLPFSCQLQLNPIYLQLRESSKNESLFVFLMSYLQNSNSVLVVVQLLTMGVQSRILLLLILLQAIDTNLQLSNALIEAEDWFPHRQEKAH